VCEQFGGLSAPLLAEVVEFGRTGHLEFDEFILDQIQVFRECVLIDADPLGDLFNRLKDKL